ncbi:MAG: hypothetical protein HZA90_27780 [Verrucomicrobia bacterium]|nr:hypothetical protein [Verrucomicrobiota bacterium]
MRLPQGNRAFVDDAKLVSYCLNPDHARGKHKARRFAAVGITEASAPILKAALLEAAETGAAVASESDPHGPRYVVDFEWETARASILVRSVWIVRTGEDFPRLVSCYML